MSLAKQRANFAKAYRNSAKALIGLIVDHVQHMKDNQHNPKELNSLFAIIEGRRDQRCFELIVSDLCSARLVEGVFKMPKKNRQYNERDYSEFNSFRSLADHLDDSKETKDKAEFDLDKFALSILNKTAKEGVSLSQMLKKLEEAQRAVDAAADVTKAKADA